MSRKVIKRQIPNAIQYLILGEGITELEYVNSIKGISNARIKPDVYKDGIEYLESKIKDNYESGLEKIFCIVDLDNKGGIKHKYDALKRKFSKKSKTGTEVIFIENNPCLEIWFYYFYKYSTASYQSYENLNPMKADLLSVIPNYSKTKVFFDKCKKDFGGLHQYLISNGGDFNIALGSSERSYNHYCEANDGAFSQMKQMFDEVLKQEVKKALSVYPKEYQER